MAWADFDDEELSILRALFNTLIPPDDHPGGWEGGCATYLERAFQGDLRQTIPVYKESVRSLGLAFLNQTPQERIHTLQSFNQAFVNLAATHAAEGYYAYPGPGWKMIGFEVTA